MTIVKKWLVSILESKITLKKTVYNAVFEDIVEGRYKANEIITEGALVEKYGVSKAPVREALIELCKDNILQSLPRLGYQVIPITIKEMVDILDFRVDLEICNLRRAAERITGEDLTSLRRDVLDLDGDYAKEVVPHWTINTRFHLQLCQLSDNRYTYQVLKEALRQSARFVSQYFNAAWAEASESEGSYHIAIVESLLVKDTQRAEEMLRQDILAVKHEVQRMLR